MYVNPVRAKSLALAIRNRRAKHVKVGLPPPAALETKVRYPPRKPFLARDFKDIVGTSKKRAIHEKIGDVRWFSPPAQMD